MRYLNKLLAFLLALLLVVGIFINPSYAAEQTIPLQDSYLSIMPEYDNNNVIVNFSGTFANTTDQDFSDEIWYYVPKDAEIYMVCETENGMVCIKYDSTTVEGDYRIVKWKPSRTIKPGETFPVMFEYFFNSFTQPGLRDFGVQFKADSALTNLTVEVKQPLRSAEFKMEPAAQLQQQDGDGFNNHIVQYPSLEKLQELNFAISYNKSDNKPSIESNDANQAAAGAADPGKQNKTFNIILLLGFLLIFGAILFFASKTKAEPAKVRPKQKKQASALQANTKQLKDNQKPAKSGQVNRSSEYLEEKKKIRKLLLDGKITEQTYHQLLSELE